MFYFLEMRLVSKILVILLSIFSTNVTLSQSFKRVTVGLAGEATSRILSLPDAQFSSNEKKTFRDLETLKPSLGLEIGYRIQNDGKNDYHFGIGFRQTRFGSKIYRLPSGVPNVTPQAPFKKNIVLQNQQYLFFEYADERIKLLKLSHPFFRAALFHNSSYKLRTYSYGMEYK